VSARARTTTIGLMLRYGMVGLVLNAAGYAVYLLATWLGAGPKSTMSVLYGVGAAAGYVGHRRWAFSYRGSVPASFLKYALVHVVGYGLNFLLLAYFADHLGYPHQLIQAIAIGVVTLFLFVAFRYFAFPQSS
jgi:putative flippase GtrA